MDKNFNERMSDSISQTSKMSIKAQISNPVNGTKKSDESGFSIKHLDVKNDDKNQGWF